MIYTVERKIRGEIYELDEDRIEAISFADAEAKLKAKEIKNAHVSGRLLMEIPAIGTDFIPDWENAINYELQINN